MQAINYALKSSTNYMPNSNNINSYFNDLKDLDEMTTKKITIFLFRQKSKKSNKTQNNNNIPNRKTNNQKTNSQNKTINNINNIRSIFYNNIIILLTMMRIRIAITIYI